TLNFILMQVSKFGSSGVADDNLKRFIYAVSALAQHVRYGGLTSIKVRQLHELAHAILKREQIEPVNSQLSFLYGDLYLMLSQARYWLGELHDSVWDQEISRLLSPRAVVGSPGTQSLAHAV